MKKENIDYFKNKLNNEGKEIKKTIDSMKETENIMTDRYSGTELSNYDNHPADFGTQLFETEHYRGLINHEEQLLSQIDHAKKNIDDGTYGICKICKKPIDPARLEAVPYTDLCITCKTETEIDLDEQLRARPVEEDGIDAPFGIKYLNKQEDDEHEGLDYLNDVLKYGSSDTTQDMGGYHDYEDFYTNDTDNQGIVDHMDKISNEEYKKQLPD